MNIKHRWSHYLGLASSALCLIHCLLLPFLAPLLSTFAPHLPFLNTHNDFKFEATFILLISLSCITIIKGYKEHKNQPTLYSAAIGFVFLVMSLFFEHNSLQIAMSVIGSSFMIFAQYSNYKYCQVRHCCKNH